MVGILILALGAFLMVTGAIVYTGHRDVVFWFGVVMSILGWEVWRFPWF